MKHYLLRAVCLFFMLAMTLIAASCSNSPQTPQPTPTATPMLTPTYTSTATPRSATTPSVKEFPICTHTSSQTHPAISGNIVVWEDQRNSSKSQHDIYGYNISTSTEFPICTDKAEQFLPAISGDTVVWEDRCTPLGDIYGYNLTSGGKFQISHHYTAGITPAAESPAISGDIIVWKDNRAGLGDIYCLYLSYNEEFSICNLPSIQSSPSIAGNIVVWVDDRSGHGDIYGYNCSSHQVPLHQEFPICATESKQD